MARLTMSCIDAKVGGRRPSSQTWKETCRRLPVHGGDLLGISHMSPAALSVLSMVADGSIDKDMEAFERDMEAGDIKSLMAGLFPGK